MGGSVCESVGLVEGGPHGLKKEGQKKGHFKNGVFWRIPPQVNIII